MAPKQRAQQLVEAGIRHHQAGRLNQAATTYRQALALEPRNADALNLLGVVLSQQDRPAEAVDLIKRAITIQPRAADYYLNLGEACRALRRYDDAITACNNAIRLQPRDPGYHHALGNALEASGRVDEAIARYRSAIQLRGDFAPAYAQLIILLLKQAKAQEALALAQKAIAIAPDLPEAQFALGAALEQNRQMEQAEACYRRVIQLQPNHASAYNQLGIVLKDTGRFTAAVEVLRAGLSIQPDHADLHGNLANTLVDQGRLDEALIEYRQALQLNPGQATIHSNLLLALNYRAGMDGRELLTEHADWAQRHATALVKAVRPHAIDRTPGRRLRIGYVSPDFREHSVAHFIRPLLAAHDHAQFEIHGYAHVARPDRVTQATQQHCDQWRDITALSDDHAAELIRRDRIDILVDLAGHTGANRLLLFARKPAPVQVTYLGYPATTGLPTIDYRLTDGQADPPGMTESFYTEKLLRLPECFLCYAAAADTPSVAPAPAAAAGHVTFASFNNLAKLVPPVLETWAKILHALPSARLILKSRGLHDAGVQEDVRQRFVRLGIAPDRLELFGASMPFLRHLELYGRVDIALDSFPYNGTTTTCEAMWMGLPVVTLAGNTHASRVGVSLLSAVGVGGELIASTPEAYVDTAVRLAGDPGRLQELRASMRPRMAASPLMDAHRAARAVEELYRQVWQRV